MAHEPFTSDALVRERWFALRSAMYALVAATRPPGTSVVVEDIAVPPEGLAELIFRLRELFTRYGYSDTGFIFGHLAAGNVHFIMLDDLDAAGEASNVSACSSRIWWTFVLGLDGSLKAEHGTAGRWRPS